MQLFMEKEAQVEMADIILSIVASVLSIVAAVIAFKSKKEVDNLRDLYESNKQVAYGTMNTQVMGTDVQVNTRGK